MAVSPNSSDPAIHALGDQLNAQTRMVGVQNGKLPSGVPPGSIAVHQTDTHVLIHFADSSRNFGAGISFPKPLQYYTGLTTTDAAPTTDDLPADGSFGFHLNTSSGKYYWAYNNGGSIVMPSLSTFAGTIADLSGTITAAQHGDLSAAVGTAHGMAQVSGTISDAQHGSKTTATLHAAATSSLNGFMTAAMVTKLALYPADCTTVANDSNAVQRASGVINATQYNVSGTKVAGARKTGYSNITATRLLNASSLTDTSTATDANFRLLLRFVATIADDLGASGHGLLDA